MAERWLPIAGYEGLYEVSNMGNVRSIPRPSTAGGLLKQTHSHGGYMKVSLSKGNHVRTCAVHRLVASAFVDNPNHKPEVNHINGDKSDNRAANLDWCTRSENEAHAFAMLGKKPNAPWKGKARRFARKFTDEQVRAIRKDSRPLRVIGMEYGVSKTAIQDIKAGKNYQEVR